MKGCIGKNTGNCPPIKRKLKNHPPEERSKKVIEKIRCILVGRHQPTGEEGLEVIRQENINFPATSQECQEVLESLLDEAKALDCCIIFQMMPGQLAAALSRRTNNTISIGIIINKPGERLAGQELSTWATQDIEEAVRFANPRAKITYSGTTITINVEPPLRFQFSHIEWL
jgi:hypothetical protein